MNNLPLKQQKTGLKVIIKVHPPTFLVNSPFRFLKRTIQPSGSETTALADPKGERSESLCRCFLAMHGFSRYA